jgi:hypothetical protein
MPLTEAQTQSLLARKGVGRTVLQRLQEMGLDDAERLAQASVDDILAMGASITRSTCWKNSPQARAAISAAVAWAQDEVQKA